MEAEDILTATHKLEESGMTRSQSEAIAKTIITAVEPLATKADLQATKANLESSIDSLKEQMATKADLESAIKSLKIWLLIILLGMHGSLLAVAVGIALTLFQFGVGG